MSKYNVEIEHYLVDGYKQTIEEYGGRKILNIEVTSNFKYKGKTYACVKSGSMPVKDNTIPSLRNKILKGIVEVLLEELIVIESGIKDITHVPLLMDEDYNKIKANVISNILKEVEDND